MEGGLNAASPCFGRISNREIFFGIFFFFFFDCCFCCRCCHCCRSGSGHNVDSWIDTSATAGEAYVIQEGNSMTDFSLSSLSR